MLKEPMRIKDGFVGQRMIVIPHDIRKEAAENPLTRGLYLTDLGYYPHAVHHYRKRKSGSGQYILLYCLEGEGWVELEGKRLDLVPNTYFMVPKGVAHQYGTSDRHPWSIYWVHFTGSFADLLYQRYCRGTAPAVLQIAYDESRIGSFRLIYALLENGFGAYNMELANIKLLQFLSSFVYSPEERALHDTATADPVNRSIAFMRKNVNQTLTVEALAAQANYSVSHFTSLFRQKTGFSPIHYFNQLKIQQACQHLHFTDRSVKEIGYELGFQDSFYFSRLFKKQMGLSPSQYRVLYQEKGA